MILFDILALILTTIIGIAWLMLPNKNWEPWLVLCGAGVAAVDLTRRLQDRKNKLSGGISTRYDVATSKDKLREWLDSNVYTAKLSESLPRALQFAKRIGDRELEHWVRLELYGYTKDSGMTEGDTVPAYRAVTGRWLDEFGRILDLSQYPELAIVNEYRFRFSIAKLEELAGKSEVVHLADDHCRNLIRTHMNVEVVQFAFSPVEIRGALDAVRNMLVEKISHHLLQPGGAPLNRASG